MARCGVAASWLGAVWLALMPSSVWALVGDGVGSERDGGGSDGDGIDSTSTFPGDSESSDWSALEATSKTTGQEPIDGLWKENLLKDTSIDDRDKWKEYLFTNLDEVEAGDVDDSPPGKAEKEGAEGVLVGEADASIDDSDKWKDYLFVNPIETEGGGDETSTPGKAEKEPAEGVLMGETDASWSILESTPSLKSQTNVPSSEPSNSPISSPNEVEGRGGDANASPMAKAEKEGPEGVLTGEIDAPWSISMNTPITCPYGGSMDVESYAKEICISFGQAICKNGWRFGISHHVDNTYLMLWREDRPSYPVFRWFPGATQMCIGEQYPNVSYLRVVHDDCEHYLVGPGAGRQGDLARLKIVEGSQNYRSGDVIVKFRDGPGDHNALWHIFADGHARTSYDTFWHHNPCETAKPTTSPADILVRGPSDKLSGALEDVAPTSTPTLKSDHPTQTPSSAAPVSNAPTQSPSFSPVSTSPTATPSSRPTTTEPTAGPTKGPSTAPVSNPPTQGPSFLPSSAPSSDPSVLESSAPSRTLSSHPSSQPSEVFSSIPSLNPSDSPTTTISNNPTFLSSSVPSLGPSDEPPASFSSMPTSAPSNVASSQSPSTPPPSLGPTANISSLPSTSPTPQPTPSPTAKPSFRIAPTASQINAEPAGYELVTTTPKEEWIWTRDYSSCNRRLKISDKTKEDSPVENKMHTRWGIYKRFKARNFFYNEGEDDEDEEEVGDDIGAHVHTDGLDDVAVLDYAVFGERSKEVRTSERTYSFDDDIAADEMDLNRVPTMTCAPDIVTAARHSTRIATPQTCPSFFSPFGGPNTVTRLSGRTVPESSGICASRINENIIWTLNDHTNHHSLYAINSIDGSVQQYPIAKGNNYDYEDIACGPGPIPDVAYIYAADIGDNAAKRGKRYFSGRLLINPIIIYRIREPNLSTLRGSDLTRWEKLKLEYPDGPHNAEAMMIDPVSERIFIISKSSGTIWMTPEQWGAGPARMTLTKVGSIKTMPDLLTGIDISPDGREIVVKFYNSIHYFCMGSRQYDNPEDSWQDIVNVLANVDGIKVPYIEEPQGEAVCFGQSFDDGIFTLSESQGMELIPLLHYERL